MDVFFESKKLNKLIHNSRDLQKKYGSENAKLIPKRLQNLSLADNLEVMRFLPGKTHELKGDRSGTLAIKLKHGYRLIFEPADDPPPIKNDGGLDWQAITSIVILAVEDYH